MFLRRPDVEYRVWVHSKLKTNKAWDAGEKLVYFLKLIRNKSVINVTYFLANRTIAYYLLIMSYDLFSHG